MHSNEAAPAGGPALLQQLGRLIVRSRSSSPARAAQPHRHKLPSTSKQIITQPKYDSEEPRPGIEAALDNHVQSLWNEQMPICIEVLLAPSCQDCYMSMCRLEETAAYDKLHSTRGLLLERWTMNAVSKNTDSPPAISPLWLMNAIRSQLHFSQLSAWRATLKRAQPERRRKLSRETCNIKKIEANCDVTDLEECKLNIVYSIKMAAEYNMAEFPRPPTDHTFPLANIGNNIYLKVVLNSLPRLDDIPHVKCFCKRRTSKEIPQNIHEEIIGKLNDLSIGRKYPSDAINSNVGNTSRRLSIISNPGSTEYLYSSCDKKILDDRMLTPCSESGKHKCSCDDESDEKKTPKKLDERRIKEIAKYKRRLRKECKIKRLCDSTSSDGEIKKETHTSIPILQAARFDRFRAIGCYRNQTYLTLPASRIESKSPFIESINIQPPEFKKTNTVGTQTDDISCICGNKMLMKCSTCFDTIKTGMVRSEGSYNLAENRARRKRSDDERSLKKLKCDISSDSDNTQCDISLGSDKCDVVKRPKLRRLFPINDRIEKIVSDRQNNDIQELKLRVDDSVLQKPEPKRQKTYSINEDYVLYEKCDYGSIDCDLDSPKDEEKFPEVRNDQALKEDKSEVRKDQIPSPSEMDRFRWRFDSAASMVFHTKTGLPLTSSPAPLRRGNNCFDFDDSINGVSGIKSALFHPISPPSPAPASPDSPPPAPAHTNTPHRRKKTPVSKLRVGSSTGLLGTFEESALKGRLEPVATVHGFTAELGASGAFCPPHRRLPVTVFFYAPGGTNAPYMGHINLGAGGYRVPRAGTVQVSLLNPHGTLVKMFVVLYDLSAMPPRARTFLRQRTLYLPAGLPPPARPLHQALRYLIHLRFMTSKSGKLYLHTDIRILVSRKADVDTATAYSAIYRPIANQSKEDPKLTNHSQEETKPTSQSKEETKPTNHSKDDSKPTNHSEVSANRTPNRVFGGCGEFDSNREIGYENQNGVAYELRSFTYAPDNPKYSPR
ncbi:protein FAM214A [Colias croceus]|uniref:protein FAM214A n=1 Tax=Colias crocea TaxID=72248 RepID=UPI001E27CE02|nr:protein FAM214A [Colias croceus]